MDLFNQSLKSVLIKVENVSTKGKINQYILDSLQNEKTFDDLLTGFLQEFVIPSKKKENNNKWYLFFYKRRIVNALINLSNISLVTGYKDINKGIVYYKLTDIAKYLFYTPQKTTDLEKDKLLSWTYDIGDKQYRSYTWNDSKVQSLLTVDAALIAGVLFILQLTGEEGGIYFGFIPLLLFTISFILLIASLIICLIHSIPKMNSKLGNDFNLRAIIGITRFPRIQEALDDKRRFFALEKYYESIKQLNEDDLIKMNSTQIVGMANNNIRSHKIIRTGVIVTIISVIFLFCGTLVLAIQNLNFMSLF